MISLLHIQAAYTIEMVLGWILTTFHLHDLNTRRFYQNLSLTVSHEHH